MLSIDSTDYRYHDHTYIPCKHCIVRLDYGASFAGGDPCGTWVQVLRGRQLLRVQRLLRHGAVGGGAARSACRLRQAAVSLSVETQSVRFAWKIYSWFLSSWARWQAFIAATIKQTTCYLFRCSCLAPKYEISNETRQPILEVEGPVCICQGPCCTWDQEFIVSDICWQPFPSSLSFFFKLTTVVLF